MKFPDMKIVDRGLMLIAVPLVIQMACAMLLYAAFYDARQQALKVAESRDFVLSAGKVERDFMQAVYFIHVYYASQGLLFKEQMMDAFDAVHSQLEALGKRTQNNATRRDLIAQLSQSEKYMHEMKNYLDGISFVELRDNERERGLHRTTYEKLFEVHRTADQLVQNITANEKFELERIEQKRSNIEIAMMLALIASVAAAIGVSLAYSSSIAGRIRALTSKTAAIADRARLPEPISGNDEISDFDSLLVHIDEEIAKTRERESKLIAEAAEMIFTVDEKLMIASANPQAHRVVGVDELVGTDILTLVHPDFADDAAAQLSQLAGMPAREFESKIRTKSGDYIDVLWTCSWSLTRALSFCVLHDITEAKDVEKLRQEFVSTISKDLTRPLEKLDGDVAVLLTVPDEDLSADAKAQLSKMQGNLTHLSRLLNDLLDMESVRSGKINVVPQHSNSRTILERAVNAVSGLAQNRNIEILCSFPAFDLNADADRIVQVLINLLSNAIKFSPSHSSVTVTCTRDETGLELAVSDRGKGIAQEDQALIFLPFERLKEDIDTREGAGLGLAICKLIVEAHGGSIGVDSKVGKGSRFWLRLPAA